ncbi:Autophagyrelated protein 18, putative, partial [Acanthamoeba castellanii str. Neff]
HTHTAIPTGDVLIFDALNLSTVNVIEKAHKGSISTLAFNDDGTLLATSSTKAKKLYEFRRGSYPARIFSIAFSRDSSLLAASSESGTVHVFQVDKAAASTSGSSMTASFMGFSSYLPEVVSDIWQPVRAFAQVKLPSPCPSLCGIAKGNDLIYVVTAEGYFYQYKLDLHAGGECKMVGEFTLFESKSEEVAATFLD